jgi:hypothetical protein
MRDMSALARYLLGHKQNADIKLDPTKRIWECTVILPSSSSWDWGGGDRGFFR